MKRIVAILFLLICVMFTLCACQKEVDMVEDMVSTVLSDDRTDTSDVNQNDDNGNNADNGNNGTITDTDGIIGNEDDTTAENNNRADTDSVM